MSRNGQRMKFERGGTGARCPRVRRARAESTASERGDDRARTSTRYEDGSFTDRSFVAFVARERSSERARERERARRVRENSIVERAAPTERPIDSRCPRARAAMMDFGELFVVPVCTEHRVGSEELAANGGEDSAAGNHEVRCVLGDARWATRRPRRGRRDDAEEASEEDED